MQKSFPNINKILELMEEEEDRMEVLIIQNPLDHHGDHVRLSAALYAQQIRAETILESRNNLDQYYIKRYHKVQFIL